MMKIPFAACGDLIAAVALELAKNIEIVISLRNDDNKPPDFDEHDIRIYETILMKLLISERETCQTAFGSDYEVDLGTGKVKWFMLDLIPAYVAKRLKLETLTHESYTALKQVYSNYPSAYNPAPFPDWPTNQEKSP